VADRQASRELPQLLLRESVCNEAHGPVGEELPTIARYDSRGLLATVLEGMETKVS
jgi:hypothetical protein